MEASIVVLASILVLSQGAVDNVYEDVVWDRASISDLVGNGNVIAMRFGTKEQVWNGSKHSSVSKHTSVIPGCYGQCI